VFSVTAASARVSIVQSSYVPWKGYFDLIAGADVFVLYDDAQYTRRDWRNRNLIKTASGSRWLTIPVEVSGRYLQRIRDVVVADSGWAEAHWRMLVHHYSKATAFAEHRDELETLYRTVPSSWLSEINHHFIAGICRLLGITTPLRWSSEFELAGDRSEKLLAVCRQLGATTYVSGPSARGYLDADGFAGAGIGVEWADYDGYREYRQLHPPFDHRVSIVDLLFSEGRGARAFLKHS